MRAQCSPDELNDLRTRHRGLAFVEFIAVAGGGTSPIVVVGTPAAVVPEPGTVALMAAGLLGLALQQRRSRVR